MYRCSFPLNHTPRKAHIQLKLFFTIDPAIVGLARALENRNVDGILFLADLIRN